MKLKFPLVTGLLALGLVAALQAEDIKVKIPGQTAPATPPVAPATNAAATAAAPVEKFTDSQLLEEYGWMIGKRIGLSDLNFTPEQVDTVLHGITLGSKGKDTPYDIEKIKPQMDTFIQAKQGEYLANLRALGRRESAAFLTDLKKKPGITVLPSGLCYEISKQGDGTPPKPTDTVTAHYTGTLVDGTVFDSSIQRGQPVEFPLNAMIPGWIEGLQKIGKGGKIRLYVPPDLAFGDEVRPGIPPSSTLIFDVEILDIKPTPPAPMPAAPAPTTPPLDANPATTTK